MPVAPLGSDRVVADEVDVDQSRLLGRERRLGIEPAGQPGLAAAEGARAQPAEGVEAVDGAVAVRPLDLEGARLAIGVDARREEVLVAGRVARRHVSIVSGIRGEPLHIDDAETHTASMAGGGSIERSWPDQGTRAPRPLIAAHRGASAAAPENTLEAFGEAIAMGADMIEFDVRRTDDGHLVIVHDALLEGRPIGSFALAELRRSRLGSGIPTLAETLELTRGRIALDVEPKEEGYESAVVDQVHQRFGRDHVVFTSFSVRSVAALAHHSGAPRAGLIVDRNTDNAIDLWREWIAEHAAEPTVADLLRAAKDSGATLIAASQT